MADYESTHSGLEIDNGIDNSATHIASTANPHSVTKEQVGLGNCDNTSDADKPISTAVQTALNGKQNTITVSASAPSGGSDGDIWLQVGE